MRRPLLLLLLLQAACSRPSPASPSRPSEPASSTADGPPEASPGAPEPPDAAHEHGAGQESAAPGEEERAGGASHAAHEHQSHAHGFAKDFSNAQAFAARFDDPARDAWQQPSVVMDLMRIPTGSVVVDLGAGTGYFLPHLAERVGQSGRVLALDVEPKMIEFVARRVEAEKLGNVEPRLIPPDDPKLAPASVSRVLIVNTWHHLGQRVSYARKLSAALAPGGEVWVVDFTAESDLGPPAKWRLSAEAVTGELEAAGLRAEVVSEPLPKQYVVRARR